MRHYTTADDHANARRLAEEVGAMEGFAVNLDAARRRKLDPSAWAVYV